MGMKEVDDKVSLSDNETNELMMREETFDATTYYRIHTCITEHRPG